MVNYRKSVSHFISGVRDSLDFSTPISYFVQSQKLQRLFFKTFTLNGIIFLGSVFLLDYAIPYLSLKLGMHQYISTEVSNILSVLAKLLWIYPLYAISFFLNASWYEEISRYSYSLTYKKGKRKKKKPVSLMDSYMDGEKKKQSMNFRRELFESIDGLVMEQIIMFLFVALSTLLKYIPFIGGVLIFFTTSWLYTYKSFNAVWRNTEVKYSGKLLYFERHAVYFLGFGAIYSVCTVVFPFFINAGLFALLFPLEIIKAMHAKIPRVGKDNIPTIKIFYIPRRINYLIGRIILKCWRFK